MAVSVSFSLPVSAPSVSEASMLVPRHLLVFINPVGGQGKSEAEFTQHVKPLFDLAEINCNIIVTGGDEEEEGGFF